MWFDRALKLLLFVLYKVPPRKYVQENSIRDLYLEPLQPNTLNLKMEKGLNSNFCNENR